MAGITDRLAVETVKPAMGFISALLAPKIKKVESWAVERELNGELDSDALVKVINIYLNKLSHRVSEITSIAFPLVKLNINEAYEPLKLKIINSPASRGSDFDISELSSNEKGSFIVIDNAGMGKSTFSKYLVGQVLYKSDRIPIFLELRKVQEDTNIVDSLVSELDYPGSSFSRDVFYKLLQMGKFTVILDGYDEVSLDLQSKIALEINELSIKGGDNILIITSRPQENLPDLMHGASLSFCSFTKEQACSLLSRYDKISELDIGLRLENELDRVPLKFIETPLLVSLLYRTFGVNNSIADRVCTFYDEIYQALYKGHDLVNKNGYVREKKSKLDFENFRILLRTLCYYMMINRKTSFNNWSEAVDFIGKSSKICSMDNISAFNFLDDLLVSVPLMVRDGTEYKFLHKTIIEYFASEYLVCHKNSSTLVEKIFKGKMSSNFSKVFEFLSEMNPSLYESIIVSEYAKKVLNLNLIATSDSLIFETINFAKEARIGLWTCSDHGRALSKHDDKLYLWDAPHDDDFDGTGVITTWTDVIVNDIKYFFAISFKDKHHNLFNHTWMSITNSIDFNNHRNDGFVDLSSYLEGLPVNTWHELSKELIDSIKYCPELNNLATNVLAQQSARLIGKYQLLSNEKAYQICTRVEREKSIEDEMECLIQ